MTHRIWSTARYATARWPRLALALLLTLGVLAALPPAPARAATITVTTGADAGTGSLRAAIAAAASGDTITFAANVSTVRITGASFNVTRNIVIQGRGTGGVRIERSGGTGRLFVITTASNVTFSGLTIAKGNTPTLGGGISNFGGMTLRSSIITGNTANGGGGIASRGTLNIHDSTISGNTATGAGGGIYNDVGGTLGVHTSTVSGNDAFDFGGGGIFNRGTLTVNTSTISGNKATATAGHGGGGISSGDGDNVGKATLNNSTVSGNSANNGPGGGIWHSFGTLTINNTTISGNTAALGGGLYRIDSSQVARLTNVTITGNDDGVAITGTSARTKLVNTVVAGNTRRNCTLSDFGLDNGGNVDDGHTCGFREPTSSSGAPAPLAPLGNYGGTTQTTPLLPGNPAIDLASGCPASDQRGIARTQGAGCDSGAFESRGFTLAGGSGTGQSSPVLAAFGAPLVVTVRSNTTEPVQGGLVHYTGPDSNAGIQPSPTLATIDASGQASATVTANDVAGGPYTVTASAGGASGTATYSLTNRTVPTALVVAPASGDYGTVVTFSAKLTVAGEPLGGRDVTFTRNGTGVGTVRTDISGEARVDVSLAGLDGGTYPTGVGATFAGDNGFASSSGTAALTVTKASQTIAFPPPPGKTYGDAPFTVTATGGGSGNPIAFGTTTPAVCTVGAPATPTSATVTLLAAGDCALTADQAGNATFAAAPQVGRTLAVGKRSQLIAFPPPPDKASGDAPFVVTATATSGLPVTFAASGVCTAAGATITLTGVAGDCVIVARQPGDANHAAAPDVSRTLAVGKVAQAITFPPPPGKTYGDAPFTVTATGGGSGNPIAFGTTTPAVCTVGAPATPTSATVTLLAAGDCALTADQAGNATFAAAPQVGRTLAVARAPQTIAFAQPPAKTYGDAPFTVVATASSGLPVAFNAGPVGVCTASGPAGATITLVGSGNCTIVARQAGDANRLPAPDVSRTLGGAVTLTVAAQGPGAASPGSGSYPVGAPVSLAASPAPGAVFIGWTVDGVNKGWVNPLALTMDTPHDIVATFVDAKTFPDVSADRPDYAAIVALASRDILLGYVNGNFGPNDTIQRAQMAALIARAMPGSGALVPPACVTAGTWDCEDWGTTFADRHGLDAGLWRNVGTLQHHGVARGYSAADCAAKGLPAPCFAPTAPVSYAETITFVTRAMVAKGYWQLQPNAPQPYAGVPAVFAPEVATYHHYTGGVPAPPANWNAQATRGWFARALWAALDSHWGADRVP